MQTEDIQKIERIQLPPSYSVIQNLMRLLQLRSEISQDPVMKNETKIAAIKSAEADIKKLLNFLT